MNFETKKNPIIERIIQLRIEHFGKRGKSYFARKLNISPSTYNYYEQDRVPPADVLLKMSMVAGVELDWLIAGEKKFTNASNYFCDHGEKSNIGRAVEALVAENPKLYSSISAFIEIICEKNNIKNPLISIDNLKKTPQIVKNAIQDEGSGADEQGIKGEDIKKNNRDMDLPGMRQGIRATELVNDKEERRESAEYGNESNFDGPQNEINGVVGCISQKGITVNAGLENEGMIPVLGRTAAGIVHCWDQCIKPDFWHAETKLSELVKKYIGKDIVCSSSGEIAFDSDAGKFAGMSNNAYIVQVSGYDDGVVEFVNSCDMAKKYPDCFGLRVDGDSMQPMICDGDIVILSPSVRAKQGAIAVVKVRDQIGVTCKIVRFDQGQVHLIAGNKNYETRIIECEQLIWAIAVLGHVKRR
ncbi:MAG TPA: LexA family transcriptional regulator [Sedimentisphaerales bacterium]|nr:LexA family transcriptional regulator [Sedimentisphaerales bacterium]